jgi:hypothetical protein
MISVEIKPGLVKCHNAMPRAVLLQLKYLQSCLRISGSLLLLFVCPEMRDPTKMANGEAQ